MNVPQLTPPFSQSLNAEGFNRGANVLGRWTRTFSDVLHLSLQSYFDYFREERGLTIESRDTADIQLEHRFPLGERNDMMWGLGYRFSADEFNATPIVAWTPSSRDLNLYTAFVQDEIAVVPDRLSLTVGSKFEHNDFTGFEIQPSARLLWTPTERQSIWASASRAVSTPGRFQREARLNFPRFQPSPFAPLFQPAMISNPDAKSETLIAYELGYRIEPARNLSFDLALFYNVYDDLNTLVAGVPSFEAEPAPPHMLLPLNWRNDLSGETYGAEVSVQWRPVDQWRLIASYSLLRMDLNPEDIISKSSPQHQLSLRSYVTLPWNLEFNSAAYYVDQIESTFGPGTATIPAYVRLDAGLVWHPTKSLEVGIWGQNLLDNRHQEFPALNTSQRTEVPRGVFGKVTLRF
jgi:iron complex outermembrane recepter protein